MDLVCLKLDTAATARVVMDWWMCHERKNVGRVFLGGGGHLEVGFLRCIGVQQLGRKRCLCSFPFYGASVTRTS